MQAWGSSNSHQPASGSMRDAINFSSHLTQLIPQCFTVPGPSLLGAKFPAPVLLLLFIPCLLLLSLVSLHLHRSTSHDNSYLAGELEVPLRPAGQPGSSVLGYVVWGLCAHFRVCRMIVNVYHGEIGYWLCY